MVAKAPFDIQCAVSLFDLLELYALYTFEVFSLCANVL